MIDRMFRAGLGAALILALIGTACGSNSPRPSASSQGFIPAPESTTTAASTATLSATTVATAAPSTLTPTPIGTPDVQASAQANGCPVTPFAPSGPPQIFFPLYPQWYGQRDLWFAPTSIYVGMNVQQLMNASVWFQGITPTAIVSSGDPTISGHLHGDDTVSVTTSPSSPQPNYPLHGINVNLPQPGCWDLTVTSGSETLNVTVWAVPITQRPDVASRMAANAAETPFAPPATCDVTTWDGPTDHLAPFFADYWVSGQGLSVDSGLSVFFAAQSSYLDIYQELPDPPTLSGQLQGDSSAVVRSSWIQRSSVMSANGWRGELTFSNPGCWQLQVTDGDAKVDLTLYVYPSDCYHALSEPKPDTCKPPA